MAELWDPAVARQLVLERCSPLEGETVALDECLGRTLACDLVSEIEVPSFDNSAMDGYAVRAGDTRGASDDQPVWLEIVGESRAGAPARAHLRAPQAIAIATGAAVPDGADAVVPVEQTRSEKGRVGVSAEFEPAANIRRAGEDVRIGERCLQAGQLLGAAELGVAASLGARQLDCVKRPEVAAIFTGDELVAPGEQLGLGQIYNSNATAIAAQVRLAGGELRSASLVGDDYERTVEAIRAGLDGDVLVLTGGVSVGRHDHVKRALAELGVQEIFWGVALKPGKPTWFGVDPGRGALVFGLPGNPVSAMVTFHLFVRPALAALVGASTQEERLPAIFDEPHAKKPGRLHVVRCKRQAREDGLHVRPTKAQGSHVLTSMLGADALAYLEVERGNVQSGETVEVELLAGGQADRRNFPDG